MDVIDDGCAETHLCIYFPQIEWSGGGGAVDAIYDYLQSFPEVRESILSNIG